MSFHSKPHSTHPQAQPGHLSNHPAQTAQQYEDEEFNQGYDQGDNYTQEPYSQPQGYATHLEQPHAHSQHSFAHPQQQYSNQEQPYPNTQQQYGNQYESEDAYNSQSQPQYSQQPQYNQQYDPQYDNHYSQVDEYNSQLNKQPAPSNPLPFSSEDYVEYNSAAPNALPEVISHKPTIAYVGSNNLSGKGSYVVSGDERRPSDSVSAYEREMQYDRQTIAPTIYSDGVGNGGGARFGNQGVGYKGAGAMDDDYAKERPRKRRWCCGMLL